MLSALLVIGGVLAALLVLLTLIVRLSARPETARREAPAAPTRSWVVDAGRPHPEAWPPLSTTTGTSEIPAVR